MFRTPSRTVAVLALVVATSSAHAQTTDSTSWHRIQANGFASFGYTHNANDPASKLNGFRIFDEEARALNLDVAELVVQRTLASPGEFGFRFDLVAGNRIPKKIRSVGLDLGSPDVDLQHAVLSYIAPLGSGLRLDVGKFVTPLGSEVIEGYDGYNDQYSRSLLFNYAIPLTHTGLKLGYAFTPKVAGTLLAVQGWDNFSDNNDAKTLGAGLALTPKDGVALFLNYLVGAEQPDNTSNLRQVFDAVFNWKVAPKVTLGANVDYGVEEGASAAEPGESATWRGVAGYVKLEPYGPWLLGIRAEQFDDLDGTRLGTGANTRVRELTLTPTYRIGSHAAIRGEVRVDDANAPVFPASGTDSKRKQTTFGLNALFFF